MSECQAPRLVAPPGACDCHMHVFEPHFGASGNPAFEPPQASAAQYLEMRDRLGLERVVVVQANCYGHDNRGMLEAMATLGEGARGVAVVAPHATPAELQRLTDLGVRGVRFHMLAGGALQWAQLDDVVARVQPFGWHVQVQLDGHKLPQHAQQLRALPVDCVIDHLGKFLDPGPPQPDEPAFRSLLDLLDGGRCWVKLSAPYESSRRPAPDHGDLMPLARALVSSHPERCLWASNWPHPARTPPPADAALLDLLLAWADDDGTRQRILVDNPARLYGFDRPARRPTPAPLHIDTDLP
jgi:D-galactarolactone isomerase